MLFICTLDYIANHPIQKRFTFNIANIIGSYFHIPHTHTTQPFCFITLRKSVTVCSHHRTQCECGEGLAMKWCDGGGNTNYGLDMQISRILVKYLLVPNLPLYINQTTVISALKAHKD